MLQHKNIYISIAFGLLFAAALWPLQQSYASSWDPTLLVNTESFQVIDDGETGSDIFLQFGDAVGEQLTWEDALGRFRFTDHLQVEGNLSASGSATIQDNLIVDTDTLFVDAATNNVGIGTDTPAALLDINGSIPNLMFHDSDISGYTELRSSNAQFLLRVDPTNVDALSSLRFDIDGAEAMRIDEDGKVGIGTPSPTTELEVVGTLSGESLTLSDINRHINLVETDTGQQWRVEANVGDFYIRDDTNGVNSIRIYDGNTTNLTPFVIDTQGDVGIGDASADAHLEISANGTSGDAAFMISTEDGNDGDILTVLEDGSVGINTTSPDALLNIEAPSDTEFIRLTDSSDADTVGVYTGVGNPEGNVAGQLGSIYIDHFGGSVYAKRGGDGATTGWEELATSTGAHVARMTRDSAQSIGGSQTQINFESETFDDGNIADTSTDRFTVSHTGSYLVMSAWTTAASLDNDDYMEVCIFRNGIEHLCNRNKSPGNNSIVSASVSDVIQLNQNDYIEMFVEQDTGTISTNTASFAAHMSVTELGGVGDGSGGADGISIGEADDRYVNVVGDSMSGTLSFDLNSDTYAVDIDSEATTNAALRIDIAGDSNSPHLLFGQGGTFDTNLFRSAADVLETDDSFVIGGSLTANSVNAGTKFTGAGLVDCDDSLNDKLLWDSVTQTFSCGTDGGGGSSGGSTSTGSALSVTTTESSTASAALYDLFEDASYPGTLDFAYNASGSILFSQTNGRFTVANTGTYLLSLTVLPESSAASGSTDAEVIISVNGSTVYQHNVNIDATQGPTERSLTIARDLNVNDYIEFLIDSQSADTITVHDGTTATVSTVGGIGSDGISAADASSLYVSIGGDTMTGALQIDQDSNLFGLEIDSEATSAPALQLDIAATSSAPHILFGSGGTFDTNLFREAANVLRTDDAFTIGGNLTVEGTATFEDDVTVHGAFSGATIAGAGLVDCDDTTNDKLLWDATTEKFICAGDSAGAAGLVQVVNFTDSTVDAVAEDNTTDYWDGIYPNITLTDASNEVLVHVSVHFEQDSGNNGDDTIVATIKRNIGSDPTCASTEVGPEFGALTSQQNADFTSTVVFLDSPATTSNVRYTICADEDSESINGDTVEEIHITLFEVNNAADLAEIYPTNDATLKSGEVLSIDPALPFGVKRSTTAHDANILGVVSTKPAQVIGGTEGTGLTGVPVALSGRVPVKVSLENGSIIPGDYLTTSSKPGVAMKATTQAPTIGQALTGYDGTVDNGYVIVFVQKGMYVPRSRETSTVEDAYRKLLRKVKVLEHKVGQLAPAK